MGFIKQIHRIRYREKSDRKIKKDKENIDSWWYRIQYPSVINNIEIFRKAKYWRDLWESNGRIRGFGYFEEWCRISPQW